MLDLINVSVENVSSIQTLTAKSGAVTTRIQTAKEFKTAYKLEHPKATAKQQTEAFNAYVRREALAMAQTFDIDKLTKMIHEKKIGISRKHVNKNGRNLDVRFVDLSDSTAVAIKEEIDKMDDQQLKEMEEFLKAKKDNLPTEDHLSNHQGEQ